MDVDDLPFFGKFSRLSGYKKSNGTNMSLTDGSSSIMIYSYPNTKKLQL